MTKNIRLAAVLACISLTAMPAFAEVTSGHVHIAIDGLDLTTANGRKLLALRIDRAAQAYCENGNEQLDSRVRRVTSACKKQVKSNALAALDSVSHVELATR